MIEIYDDEIETGVNEAKWGMLEIEVEVPRSHWAFRLFES